MEGEKKYTAGILLQEGVELLSVAGAAEVFSAAADFRLICLGLGRQAVNTSCGLTLLTDIQLEECPHLEVLVLPESSQAWREPDENMLRWLKAMSIKATVLLAKGHGIFLLAAAGLLDGRRYTCSPAYAERLRQMLPAGRRIKNRAYVDDNNLITTAGATGCVDGALQSIKNLRSRSTAQKAAARLEYTHWQQNKAAASQAWERNAENRHRMSNK